MAKPTVLLTAARFGAGYFLDILQSARPGSLVLGEPFRGTSAGLAALAEASGRAVPELQKMDAAALWALVVEVATGQAGPGVVGPAMTSTCSNAVRKSSRISRRACWAFL